jgi:hypothetical protein
MMAASSPLTATRAVIVTSGPPRSEKDELGLSNLSSLLTAGDHEQETARQAQGFAKLVSVSCLCGCGSLAYSSLKDCEG